VQWPDTSGWKVEETQRRLHLQGVGDLKYRRNRPLRGVPKTITVRREGRRWFVTVFCVDVPAQPLPETGLVAGIDLGIAALAVASDGTVVANHRPGRRAAERLRPPSRTT
jgi:putative transposase